MTRTILIFLGALLFSQFVIAALVVFSGFPLPNSMSVICLMVSLAPPIMDFVKREGRIMTLHERSIFALWVTLISVVPSIILVNVLDGGRAIRMLAREWQRGNMGMVALFIGIAVAVPVVTWLVAYFTALMFGKKALKTINAKKA
jgi:hypothetical protein